jgi:hypothetical protein
MKKPSRDTYIPVRSGLLAEMYTLNANITLYAMETMGK